ncbi:MAG: hypothetical protein A3A28_05115 [Candidatus Sungbacteria bacterium RIFCSPLOWO2_01_FULL_47_32]|uniref:Response regulatory domain-containing protein n=1 Tax=Candidatus Sungbacteria bacterium RIFCSPHIGHO2_01_FULL_47_32 TaxID=1802264 RepID=A0A1G2K5F7_9BACT|nr:MAG: Two component transcriptional regulator, winged helix family [Parcubacteria group bacterium GW2011_GWA2_47_10]OGZ94615.1 MAG: hypothetical protein A2633_01190 [Candidatus Sungbacteria bacterium RIFCSPHIGHO2_01_FULL_47_32]OGZ98705.1 MAG: hypothetical protein A3D57_00260 [Candidatus Sungbacteria bacterium RIFCSPHIGHO2_02_FULL_46_12]OHA04855.1 MAG: hypothetical protein A3A28_05115 [Candidatus Sungbacteria bacterium RIFCSPLOWO2_01_FULL_47_32]
MAEIHKKILVVEDEPALRDTIKNRFVGEGFTVLAANDGVEGLEMALAEHPDLILLDIIMPKMDGITMLKKLRQDSWGKGASIFMLTNLSDEKKVSDSMEEGVFDYLIKADWMLDELIFLVKKKLGVS